MCIRDSLRKGIGDLALIDPLAKLSQVAAQLGQGKVPDPLPEDAGTAEIQAVNMSFNRMVQDLSLIHISRRWSGSCARPASAAAWGSALPSST